MNEKLHECDAVPRVLEIGTVHRILTGGNHPLLCQLEDAKGPAGLWVMKPDRPCVTSRGLARRRATTRNASRAAPALSLRNEALPATTALEGTFSPFPRGDQIAVGSA